MSIVFSDKIMFHSDPFIQNALVNALPAIISGCLFNFQIGFYANVYGEIDKCTIDDLLTVSVITSKESFT